MEFRLLGAVTAFHRGSQLDLGRRQERCLLGLLLLEPNRIVAVDRLLELLWDNSPHPTAKKTLQTYVARLRASLAPLDIKIANRGGGYLIQVDPMTVDVHRFTAQVGLARGIPEHRSRAIAFRTALELWRGPLLGDVAGAELSSRLGLGLAELRLSAIESQLDAELAAGDHEQVLAPLTDLLASHPTRERVAELLMVALSHSGRTADALSVFRSLRRTLVTELGLEPGPQLQALHRRLLNNNAPVGGLRFLPRDLPDFTGRAEDLALLDEFASQSPGAVLISAVAGIGGVGKTALAVRWAHRVASRFPDGQFFINLRGYDPRGPMPPVEAIGIILRAFGIPEVRIPSDVQEAAAMYRAVVADKQILVLLDNAGSVDQVRPLLPGGSGSLVLVTSRELLGGLIARDGARSLRLDALSRSDAVDLLRHTLGRSRADAEADAVGRLADLCGHLPLALRIAAANLAKRPQQTVAGHVAQMESDDRLAMLAVAGDPDSAVSAVFDLSYRQLDPALRRVFRLLGPIPGGDFSVDAVAAMTELSAAQAAAALERLVDSCLVIEHSPGRYAMHDLLKAYAAGIAWAAGHDAERVPAIERLLTWLEERTKAADIWLGERTAEADPAATGFADQHAAIAWLDAERANLAASVKAARSLGVPQFAWRIGFCMRSYYFIRMAPTEMIATGEACLAAAQAGGGGGGVGGVGDVEGTTSAELIIGQGYNLAQRAKPAALHIERALALATSAGLERLEVDALNALAVQVLHIGNARRYAEYGERLTTLAKQQGRPYAKHLGKQGLGNLLLGRLADAAAALERALVEGHPAPHGLSITLMNLGETYTLQGRYGEAEEAFGRAIELLQGMGSPHLTAVGMTDLSRLLRETGRYDEAWECINGARAVLDDSQDSLGKVQMRSALAMLMLETGRAEEAVEVLLGALQFAQEFDNPHPTTEALVTLSLAHQRLGAFDKAMACAVEADEVATKFEFQLLKGKALNVIADLHRLAGEADRATEAASAALEIHLLCGYPQGVSKSKSLLANR